MAWLFAQVLVLGAVVASTLAASGFEASFSSLHRLKKGSPLAKTLTAPSILFAQDIEQRELNLFGKNAFDRVFTDNDLSVINKELEEQLRRAIVCSSTSSLVIVNGQVITNTSHNSCDFGQNLRCENHQQYRTIDGTCNNRAHPKRGAVDTPLLRLAPPQYNDGFQTVKIAGHNGHRLPGARKVSLAVAKTTHKDPDPAVSMMVFRLGQFLDHDISFTPEEEENPGHHDPCEKSEATAPIAIERDDPWYDGRKRHCLPFARSLPTMEPNHQKNGPKVVRQQLNDITAYIDASNVYGSSKEILDKVRDSNSIFLRTSSWNQHKLMPLRGANETGCIKGVTACFRAGDGRVNENAGLASMHTMWVLQHNKIAQKIKDRRSYWSNEKIFQETRRIIGAMHQHITYNEFLPVILGDHYMRKYNLKLHNYLSPTYNPSCDPTVTNEFATAAFRFGHTFVGNRLFAAAGGRVKRVDLVKNFNDPSSLTKPGYVGGYLKGDAEHGAEPFDRFFVSAVRNRLFETNATRRDGLDLVSLNIQRGRDHGLPSYSAYMKFCGYDQVNRWNDLEQHMTPGALTAMKKVYRSVKDIDLFIGIVSEKMVPGGHIGRTGACILGHQFRQLRCGDRFWYENAHTYGFTSAQLRELKKTTLAGTICAATGINSMRGEAFKVDSPNTNCKDMIQPNFNAW
jgi:peroxidase